MSQFKLSWLAVIIFLVVISGCSNSKITKANIDEVAAQLRARADLSAPISWEYFESRLGEGDAITLREFSDLSSGTLYFDVDDKELESKIWRNDDVFYAVVLRPKDGFVLAARRSDP